MVKKKKNVFVIKTSLKSVLLDNEAAKEFTEKLEALVKKQHLLRIGSQQFLHWYLLNEKEPREMNVEFIRAVLTVLNGSRISNTNSSFGNKLVYLKPLIDEFIRVSKFELLFAPTLASPAPIIEKYYTVMFSYMAKDIFKNNQEIDYF